jgi:hypothetical protein
MLRQAGVTECELRALEEYRLYVPVRTWKTLWLVHCYHLSHRQVIRWLVACRRTAQSFREREVLHRLARDERTGYGLTIPGIIGNLRPAA